MKTAAKAWRSVPGHNPSPEGHHQAQRSAKLTEGLRAGLSFPEALRRAEVGENPSKGDFYAAGKRPGKRTGKAFSPGRWEHIGLESPNAIRSERMAKRFGATNRNPGLPGLSFAREHWLPLAATGVVGVTLAYAAKQFRRIAPMPQPHVSVEGTFAGAPTNAANSVNAYTPPGSGYVAANRVITAADAVRTDQGEYQTLATNYAAGRHRP